MWKVITKNTESLHTSLNLALKYAKSKNEFVTITDGTTEIVGKFGVAEVTDPLYNGWVSRKKDHVRVAE